MIMNRVRVRPKPGFWAVHKGGSATRRRSKNNDLSCHAQRMLMRPDCPTRPTACGIFRTDQSASTCPIMYALCFYDIYEKPFSHRMETAVTPFSIFHSPFIAAAGLDVRGATNAPIGTGGRKAAFPARNQGSPLPMARHATLGTMGARLNQPGLAAARSSGWCSSETAAPAAATSRAGLRTSRTECCRCRSDG